MPLELYDAFGGIDIAAIDPAEVAKLTEPQQQALADLIPKVQAREAAQERYNKAVRAQREANAEQTAALEAHIAANPAISHIAALQAVSRANS